ncbi:MAG TPA: hypothetical protein VJ904_02830, partial [Tichowtungia sp.]|nr:hypothetical protein [Tichowtungia sp.]
KGWNAERIAKNRREINEWMARAKKKVEEENKARKARGEPPKIIQNWYRYIYSELNWDMPYSPPAPWKEFAPYGYTSDELFDHLDVVVESNYESKKLKKPVVHIVKLIAADGNPVDPPGGPEQAAHYSALKDIAKAFRGEFELLQGADSVEDILQANDLGDD